MTQAAKPAPSRQLVVATRAVGRAAVVVGRTVRSTYLSIDPDLRRYLLYLPILWLQRLARPSPPVALPDDGHPVVILIHGMGGGPGNFAALRRHLRRRGRKRTYALALCPDEPIELLAARVAAYVDAVVTANGLDRDRCVDLVAHSMGGVIARVALNDDRLRARVARVVTLGTPHAGTWLARFAVTIHARQLRPTSPLYAELDAQVPWPAAWPPITALWSRADVVVMPPESARLDGAINVELPGFSHHDYLRHRDGFRTIDAALAA